LFPTHLRENLTTFEVFRTLELEVNDSRFELKIPSEIGLQKLELVRGLG
jgi:hypothetical protein